MHRSANDVQKDYAASFAQQRMWLLDRLDGDRGAAYVTTPMWRLHGLLDRFRFQAALDTVVARHDALRSIFLECDGTPRVVLAPSVDVAIDWRTATSAYEIDRQAGAEAERPFDLTAGPLLRVVVWQVTETEHVLLAAMHHIVSDGWSMGVLVRELATAYDGEPLPELPVRYVDFAEWQRRELDGQRLGTDLDYWRERLAGLPVLELPTDRPRPARASWAGAMHEFTLDPELVAGLERLGRRRGATLYMTLLAAFQVLLSRWTGQRDFGVGSPVAGRNRPEVENVIGFFVNTVVMRADLSGDPTFTELLDRVREDALDALDHQDVPYERVVRELRPERPDTDSLIEAWFAMQNVPGEVPSAGALRFTDFETDRPKALFPVSLFAQPRDDQLAMTVVYRRDLFDAATIGRLVQRCRELLAAVVVDPGVRVGVLGLPAAETVVLRRFGRAEVTGRVDDAVAAFEDRVRCDPDALAVVAADGVLSYVELNVRANRVAWWLRGRGVRRESLVGVRLPRGVDMLVAVLGVLKAGGAYVPLDPGWPAERIDFVCADAGIDVLLDGVLPDGGRDDDLNVAVDRAQLAYVIYTSGSTGRPKGVGVSRGAMAAHVSRMRQRFGLGPADRVLQFAALAFDASVEQIFPALSCGAALVLPEHGLVAPATLLPLLDRHQVTVMEVVPSYLTELFAEVTADGVTSSRWTPAQLRLLVLGGEVVRPEDLAWWRRHHPAVAVVNTYGPTEVTVTTTVTEALSEVDAVVPIGRSVGDRALYVLDSYLAEVPVGAVGELFVGGTQLARGYLGRPGLTAERFVPDPFGRVPGGRLYRTGDLVRWRPDGQLEFHGRDDGQVKVRGFRVEVGEVEARLRKHQGVRDAVVTVWQNRLVAYVAGDGVVVAEVRSRLAEQVPEFMVPAVVVVLAELPRTVGGKVDRDRLPDPEGHHPETTDGFEEPRTPTEKAIADVWRQVLRVDRISVHDNFFHLGGHSLLATRVAIRLRAAFGWEVAVGTLFEQPTVARLAAEIEKRLMAEIAAMSSEDVEHALKEQ